jgi:hypothetical protein
VCNYKNAKYNVEKKKGAKKWGEKESGIKRKGIGTERTFKPLKSLGDQRAKLSELCASLAKQLADEDLSGRTVTIKVPYCIYIKLIYI